MRAGPGAALAMLVACVAVAAWAAGGDPSAAGAPAADRPVLRVGTSLDYPPFSEGRGPADAEGFDVALLRAFARDRGAELRWVRFRWPHLLRDLAADRFDLAASGITVRPERSAAGRFAVPVAESAALVLARTPQRWIGLGSFDRPSVRIGVNAGGHLERVARAHLPRATLLAIPDNDAVVRALIEGVVDAVVTDTLEVPLWEARVPERTGRFGPLSRDRKAWLLRPERAALAAELDAWLLAREADGTLARLRAEHLGAPEPRTAEPLAVLLAAVDERLSLMPRVGFVKRRDGVPLEVPEREDEVLDAALADVRAAAERAGREPPGEPAVRALFRAQMEAAKEVQWNAVKDPAYAPEAPHPGLGTALRPGLERIGARIARLLLALPPGLEAARVREAAATALRTPYLSEASRRDIADAIAACSPPPEEAESEEAEGEEAESEDAETDDAEAGGAQPARVSARATKPAATGRSTHAP